MPLEALFELVAIPDRCIVDKSIYQQLNPLVKI